MQCRVVCLQQQSLHSNQFWRIESKSKSTITHIRITCNQRHWCFSFSILLYKHARTHAHTPVYRPFSRTTQVSQFQKGQTSLYFTEASDSEWQWHQLGHVQVCTSLQTDNHANTPPLRPDALPAAQPAVSKHWRQIRKLIRSIIIIIGIAIGVTFKFQYRYHYRDSFETSISTEYRRLFLKKIVNKFI